MEGHHMPSWLRDTLKLFVQYLGVGFASIPTGILYLILLDLGIKQNAALVVALCIGLISAHLVWKLLGRRVLLQHTESAPAFIGTNTIYAYRASRITVGGLGAAALVVIQGATPMPHSNICTIDQGACRTAKAVSSSVIQF